MGQARSEVGAEYRRSGFILGLPGQRLRVQKAQFPYVVIIIRAESLQGRAQKHLRARPVIVVAQLRRLRKRGVLRRHRPRTTEEQCEDDGDPSSIRGTYPYHWSYPSKPYPSRHLAIRACSAAC